MHEKTANFILIPLNIAISFSLKLSSFTNFSSHNSISSIYGLFFLIRVFNNLLAVLFIIGK